MRRVWAIAAALCWLIAGLSANAWAQNRKLIVAVLDQITWHDLLADDLEAPTLRRLAGEGAVGVMCVRTARGDGGAYLTIGAGSRAGVSRRGQGRALEGYALQASEVRDGVRAERLFRSYTGWPAGDNAIVHLGIGELMRESYGAAYPLRLGLLGGTLRRSGFRVACIGNADTARAPHREAVCIAMNEQGLVELGSVAADLLRPTASEPYRLTTDPARFLAAFHRAAAAADLIVLDLGETSRVAEYAQQMPSTAARAARLRAIQKADQLLGQVLERLVPEDWAVLVVAPNARETDPGESFAALTPVIFHVPGEEPGLLTSPSTRRAALVLNTDVAPTVLEHFGVEMPSDIIGRPMARQPAEGEPGEADVLSRLEEQVARDDASEICRGWLFRSLPAVAAVVLWSTALLFVLGDRAPRWARTLMRGLLIILLAVPPAALLVALRPLDPRQMLAAAAGGALVIAFLSGWITGWRSGHVLPAVALVGLLTYDLLKGQAMLQWSPLSYSPAGGARFYGIGNEYAGAFLGAALVSACGLLSRRDRAPWGEYSAAALVLFALAGLVGIPRYGANLGVAVACAVGFAFFALYLWREYPGWGDMAALLVLALGLVAAAIAGDVLLRGTEASHIGRWAASVKSEGWRALLQVMVRKWSMNWTLMRASMWTEAAIAGLGLLAAGVLARPRRLLAELEARSWLAPAVGACVVGAVVAWLLNDSGILAAALALLYGAGSLGYVGLAGPDDRA